MRLDPTIYPDQFGFQRRHSTGRILNVGCNTDGANLKQLYGAINLDLGTVDNLNQPMPVDVIADARSLPFRDFFDTVVLGEILEHMERPTGVQTILEAKAALRPGGRIVITMPHDVRREDGTLEIPAQQFYTEGIYAYHYRCIPWEELVEWLADAGCRADVRGHINYPWGETGSGAVVYPVL